MTTTATTALEQINGVDLAFVVDTTGSMSPLIGAAQRQLIELLDGLARAAAVDLRLGVVEYRDHPPEDQMVYRVHPFTGDLERARGTIMKLRADGGGDVPEAVLDGVLAACWELAWRPHARRLAVLVGDAPPHGAGTAGDAFPEGCPCGETIASVAGAAEEERVTVYALGLTGTVAAPFGDLSHLTGGRFFPAKEAAAAIEHLAAILRAEFGELDLDRRVLAAWQAEPDVEIAALAERLGRTRHAVSAAWVRLLSRDLIDMPAVRVS